MIFSVVFNSFFCRYTNIQQRKYPLLYKLPPYSWLSCIQKKHSSIWSKDYALVSYIGILVYWYIGILVYMQYDKVTIYIIAHSTDASFFIFEAPFNFFFTYIISNHWLILDFKEPFYCNFFHPRFKFYILKAAYSSKTFFTLWSKSPLALQPKAETFLAIEARRASLKHANIEAFVAISELFIKHAQSAWAH